LEAPDSAPVIGQKPNDGSAMNLKTAKALGLELSPMLLATADEVIE